MNESNEAKVLALIHDDDVVLDIGGAARPFNRADYILDAEPYETRGWYGPRRPAQGGIVERFTQETWIRRDICDHTPYPFGYKEIDFVICSQTLEDVRDPIWVCSEMNRIAKRGYVEVPTREGESSRGAEPGIVGLSHHRWLIDIADNEIVFTMKNHMIHGDPRLSLPASYRRRHVVPAPDQWLFWEGSFGYREVTIHGVDNVRLDLEEFIRSRYSYSRPAEAAFGAAARARQEWTRWSDRVRRLLNGTMLADFRHRHRGSGYDGP